MQTSGVEEWLEMLQQVHSGKTSPSLNIQLLKNCFKKREREERKPWLVWLSWLGVVQ